LRRKTYSILARTVYSELFQRYHGTLDAKQLAMKFKFHSPEINPIYRDLVMVILAGFLASMAIVTIGFMILAQL
jgi:hypothetical protein